MDEKITKTFPNDRLFAAVLEELSEGRSVTIPVKGYSMLPFIRQERDLVVLEKADGDIRPMDIVLFRYADRYILHRVISIKDGRYAVQGDGVYRGWEYPSREQILAKVSTILKNGDKAVDPYSPGMLRQVKAWRSLGGLRRYILFIDRHLRKYHED